MSKQNHSEISCEIEISEITGVVVVAFTKYCTVRILCHSSNLKYFRLSYTWSVYNY